MYNNKKTVVVMPAYNAAETLLRTYREVIAQPFVDQVVVVDDASRDETADIARTLDGVIFHRIERNRGYGGNQKIRRFRSDLCRPAGDRRGYRAGRTADRGKIRSSSGYLCRGI